MVKAVAPLTVVLPAKVVVVELYAKYVVIPVVGTVA
jgi:hypothetical protein